MEGRANVTGEACKEGEDGKIMGGPGCLRFAFQELVSLEFRLFVFYMFISFRVSLFRSCPVLLYP